MDMDRGWSANRDLQVAGYVVPTVGYSSVEFVTPYHVPSGIIRVHAIKFLHKEQGRCGCMEIAGRRS